MRNKRRRYRQKCLFSSSSVKLIFAYILFLYIYIHKKSIKILFLNKNSKIPSINILVSVIKKVQRM